MGGLGSGTWTRRPTKPMVEGALSLDLYTLIRDGTFLPVQITSGSLTWTRSYSNEEIGSIGYSSDLTATASGSVRPHYYHNGSPVDSRVSLTTTRPYFGGVRWWFVCPAKGTRAAKLHLPPGSDIFASRRAFDMAYRSQNETSGDRLRSRAQEIRRRFGGSCSLLEPPPPNRKGCTGQRIGACASNPRKPRV
jgi:hypothetical protein